MIEYERRGAWGTPAPWGSMPPPPSPRGGGGLGGIKWSGDTRKCWTKPIHTKRQLQLKHTKQNRNILYSAPTKAKSKTSNILCKSTNKEKRGGPENQVARLSMCIHIHIYIYIFIRMYLHVFICLYYSAVCIHAPPYVSSTHWHVNIQRTFSQECENTPTTHTKSNKGDCDR